MERDETRITSKYQTTIPRRIRKYFGVRPGEKVEWHIVKGMVVVEAARRVRNPVKFLTSQVRLNLDAVKLVRRAREEFR